MHALPSLLIAGLVLASAAQATPERAAQMQAQQQAAAEAAPPAAEAAVPPETPAAMPAADGEFPPGMVQAIAEREAREAAATAAPTTGAEPATGADDEPIPQLSEKPAGPPISDQVEIDRRAQTIAEGLRCPVCQGLSAGDSQAESAIAMRTRAGDLVAAGYSDAQINAYFVERYGEWVLLEPPRSGRHWLIWLGPLAFLGLGLLVVAWRMTAEAKPEKAAISTDDAEQDAYERRILDELDRS